MQYVPAVYMSHVEGAPKNALSECCWSHSALAQTQVTGTPCVWKLTFWSFFAMAKPDQAFASHVHGKFSHTALNFDYDFVPLVHFWDTLYVYTNTRTQIPLDTYKQVYQQTEIRVNYAKCYDLREILLICVRCSVAQI